MDFGALLKATLKKHEIPVIRFTEDIGFNRVAIYSVFKNKRKLPKVVFEKILASYPFSKQEKLNLERAFRLSQFESERFEMMAFIKTEFEKLGKAPDCTPEKSENLDFSRPSIFLSGRADYNAAVETLLKRENTAENAVVYTNYSYFDEQTDKIVYDFVKNDSCRLVIRHSVIKGTGDNVKERLHNGFAGIKFAKLGHITSVGPRDEPPFALSTHFIGEKSVVMYDEKTQCGFFSTEETVVRAYCLSAAKRESARTPLNRVFENAFELKSFTEPMMSKNDLIIIESTLPVRYFTKCRILDETLKKDIPEREVILSSFWNHLLICRSLSNPSVFTQSSIRHFLENGKSYDAPEFFLNNISVLNRRRILDEAKKELLSEESRFSVIRDSSFEISEKISVASSPHSVSVFYMVEKPGCDFLGSGVFTVYGEEFSSLLGDFYDYLFVNDFFLSKEELEKELDSAVAQCI